MSNKTTATTAEKLARFNRISWKQAFGLITGAPLRLHRYRDIHTRMLQESFYSLDCRKHKTVGCDE